MLEKFDKNHSSNVLCKAEQDQKEAIGILPSSSLQKFDPRYIYWRDCCKFGSHFARFTIKGIPTCLPQTKLFLGYVLIHIPL